MNPLLHKNLSKNEVLLCNIPSCQNHRKGLSYYCTSHLQRRHRYGHPLAGAIRPKIYATQKAIAQGFVSKQSDHTAIKAALSMLSELLSMSAKGEPVVASKELQRLSYKNVTPKQILEEILSVWLLSVHRPGSFKNDRQLTYSLALAVIHLAPLDVVTGWSNGKPTRYAKRPTGSVRAELGQFIRSHFGVLLMNAAKAIEEAEEGEKSLKQQLQTPFV